jgi:hypothetical protein
MVQQWLAACLLTYLIQPLLEKRICSQLAKKFPVFYWTRGFITALTSARHLSLPSARSIQYMPQSHFLKIRLNIILQSMLGSSTGSLYLRIPNQNPVYTFPLPHTCCMVQNSRDKSTSLELVTSTSTSRIRFFYRYVSIITHLVNIRKWHLLNPPNTSFPPVRFKCPTSHSFTGLIVPTVHEWLLATQRAFAYWIFPHYRHSELNTGPMHPFML